MITMQRNVNNSVFVNLFREKKYLIELYQVLHPEDDAISEDDLEVITLENVLTNDMYNDLGFLVRDKLIVLVEAQTTWSRNIIMRMFLYLARTYQDLIYNNSNLRVSLYSSKKMELPKPELYVIYTGSKGDKSETLSLKDDVFPDSDNIDLKAKVIFADKTKRDIINQYIAFCGILKEQMNKNNGDKQKAIHATIRICIETDNLCEYLENHKKEVEDDMFSMLTQEEIIEDMVDDARSKGRAEGVAEAKREFAKTLLARNQFTNDEIASMTGLSIQEISNLAQR